jgi:hypothetical protein
MPEALDRALSPVNIEERAADYLENVGSIEKDLVA